MTFRLRTLLIGITAVGVLLFLLTAAPSYVAVPALVAIWLFIAGLLLAGIVYGSGRVRAFCLGGMFPAGGTVFALTWLLFSWMLAGPWETRDVSRLLEFLERFVFMLRIWSVAGWLLVVTTGLSCMIGRTAFLKPGQGGDE